MRLIPIFAVVICVGLLCAHAVQGQDPQLDSIIRVWRARQERVASCKFVFREKIAISGHTYPGKNTDMFTARLLNPNDDIKSASSGPLGAMVRELKKTLVFNGEKMRYTAEGPQWESAKEKFLDRVYISAFDGGVEKVLFGAAEDVYPAGFVNSKAKKHPDADNRYLAVLFRYWLPFHPVYGTFQESQWKAVGDGVAAGRQCLVVAESTSSWVHKYWIDLERDCLLLRCTTEVAGDGTNVARLDISYQEDKDFKWAPKKWRHVTFSPQNNSTTESFEGEMLEYKINSVIDPGEFECVFPPGTLVTDQRNNMYILRDNGEEREITSEEMARKPSYQELLRTSSGQANLPSKNWKLWLLFLFAVATLAIALLALKKWRGQRKPSS